MNHYRHVAAGMLAFAIVASLALSGCSSASGPIVLSEKDAGSVQQLAVGQRLEITLEANPTTGYQWAVDGGLPPCIEQIGEPEYKAQSSAIGGGGTETWTFAGKSAGQGDLKLKYWRSFEPTVPPVKTFSVTVHVK